MRRTAFSNPEKRLTIFSFRSRDNFAVMPGLVPGIHVFAAIAKEQTWMAGTTHRRWNQDASSTLGQWPTWQTKVKQNPSFTIN
jgi:hypothetical protein